MADLNHKKEGQQEAAEGSQLAESKVKEMRRIAERTEIPTDKAELIQYLSERITQAEDALTDTEQLLQSETAQRQKISKSIAQRNQQLQKLYQVDQRGLPDKIKEKLTQILTMTVGQKMEAEQLRENQKNRNYEYNQVYKELKWEEKNLAVKLEEQKAKEDALSADIAELETKNQQHQTQLRDNQAQFTSLKQKKESLQNKYLQMKVALERMTDIKAVLNRFFSNQDLFDEVMELKQQKIVRVQIPKEPIGQQRLPTRDLKQNTKLKPIGTAKNDDEDFWRGDFSRKGHR